MRVAAAKLSAAPSCLSQKCLKRFINDRHQSLTLSSLIKAETRRICAPPHETNPLLMRKSQHVCSAYCKMESFPSLLFQPFKAATEKCEQVESQGWQADQLAPPCQMCTEKRGGEQRKWKGAWIVCVTWRDRKMMQGFISCRMKLIRWWEADRVTTHLQIPGCKWKCHSQEHGGRYKQFDCHNSHNGATFHL